MSERDIVKSIIAANAEPPMDPALLSDEEAFSSLGIDSLKFMLIIIDIERQLGRPIFTIDAVPSINAVKDIVCLV